MDSVELVAAYPSMFSPEELPIPWTESPFLEALIQKSGLGDADRETVRGFARDGYLVFDAKIEPSVLDGALADLASRHPLGPTGVPQRLQDAWRFSDAVANIATAPKVLEMLQLLYRRPALPFQTLNFAVGTQQRTHSDTIHFQTHPANWMCGVWIALEDIDEDNGPLHYYPGSHSERPYDMGDLELQADYAAYPSYEDFIGALASARGWTRTTLTMPRGSALIWSANLLHGGESIRDQRRTRHSQVTHYYFPGCTYYTPMSSDLFLGRVDFRTDTVDIRTGDPLAHSYKGHSFRPVRSVTTAVRPARLSGSSAGLDFAEVRTWKRWVPPALVPAVRKVVGRVRAARQ